MPSLIGNQAMATLNKINIRIIISKIHLMLKSIFSFYKEHFQKLHELRFGSNSKMNSIFIIIIIKYDQYYMESFLWAISFGLWIKFNNCLSMQNTVCLMIVHRICNLLIIRLNESSGWKTHFIPIECSIIGVSSKVAT